MSSYSGFPNRELLTEVESQAGVYENCRYDTQRYLTAKNMGQNTQMGVTHVRPFPMSSVPSDYNINKGEILFSATDQVSGDQYPLVLSNLSVLTVPVNEVMARNPKLKGKTPDSVEVREAAAKQLFKKLRIVGVATTETQSRDTVKPTSDDPVATLAGMADMLCGDVEVRKGDWLVVDMPPVEGRRFNIQGVSMNKRTLTVKPLRRSLLQPALEDVKADLEENPTNADAHHPFTTALQGFFALAKTSKYATLGDMLASPEGALKVTEVLGNLSDAVSEQLSRVIGQARTDAGRFQHVTVHLKQVPL